MENSTYASYPIVSILVAARNEEENISRCLRSLEQLNYPKEQVEILIGNDQSTDSTEAVIQEYIQHKPAFRYFHISQSTHNLRGKANVLAQLAREARGDYLFFCDADIAVHPAWVDAMLSHFTRGVGVVVGVTRMTAPDLWASMQSLEWLLSQSVMRFFSLWQIPFTGMGNNMAVSREAYRKVGGYEKIGFSIVEDYALFMATLNQGYAFVQGFHKNLVSVSQPAHSVTELLRQRKRWVKGAMAAPWGIRLSFYISALLLPFLLLVAFWTPGPALVVALAHYLIITFSCGIGIFILSQNDLYRYLPLLWFYFVIINTMMLINFLLPTPTVWKGRQYD